MPRAGYAIRVVSAAALLALLALIGVGGATTAHANGCTENVCATASGSSGVSTQQPTSTCGMVANPGGTGDWNNMAGCNDSNYMKWGYADHNGVQQWAEIFGWTYVGTGDGERYFTFGMNMFTQPMVSYYDMEISDGHFDNCGGYVSPCNFDPWNDYADQWQSPSTQLRSWVDGSERPSNQAYRQLENPQIGQVYCVGNGTGQTTHNVSSSVTVGGNGISATLGADDTTIETFNQNGECNANSDAYSTFFNLNWEGGVGSNTNVQMTHSALYYEGLSAAIGPNGSFYNSFNMNMNMIANWYNGNTGNTDSWDLFDNLDKGLNVDYESSLWNY